MRKLFYTPWFLNFIGWMYVWLYKATFVSNEQVYIMNAWVTVNIYRVTRFPFMKSIMGQAVGHYLFIRSDIKRATYEWKRIFLHETKHIEQQYTHGWFGMWFLIKYVYQLVVYTIANMGLFSIALKTMPLEKEAYATESQLTPPAIVSPKSV